MAKHDDLVQTPSTVQNKTEIIEISDTSDDSDPPASPHLLQPEQVRLMGLFRCGVG